MKPLKNLSKDQANKKVSNRHRPENKDDLDSRKTIEVPGETILYSRVDLKKKIQKKN